jgi:predicted transposase YdaD
VTNKPHDALFKAGFETPSHAADLFRQILPPSLANAIAWDTIERESGSFVAPDLADRHSDLLFSVQLSTPQAEHRRAGGTRVLLYLLLEHRSTNDHDLLLRMLEYLVQIWLLFRKKNAGPLPLIIPAVVSHAPEGWTAPRFFHEMFEPPPDSIPGLAAFVPNFSLLVEDLTELDDAELQRWGLSAFSTLTIWVLRDGRHAERLEQTVRVWAPVVRALLHAPNGRISVEQLLRYLWLVTGELRFEDFRAKIIDQIPETEEVAMTIAEELEAKGEARGIAKGRVRGRAETVAKLLVLKFGSVSVEHATLIERATEQQLDLYIERILTASTAEAVFSPEV